MPRPVLFGTDALLGLLLLLLGLFVLYARRDAHLRAAWARVLERPLAMAAAVVLAAYAAIAVLDSVHFHPPLEPQTEAQAPVWSTRVQSLLDLALQPLVSKDEKTYSAPLATHAWSMETVQTGGDGQVRLRPRLQHGGAHLSDPERERWPDILSRAAHGSLQGAGAACLLTLAITLVLARRWKVGVRAALGRVLRGGTRIPWRIMLATAAVLLVLGCVTIQLAEGYHVLGTDKVGQDVLYQALKSIRTGLVIGTLTTLITLPFALMFGISAGYFGGRIDDAIQYLYTTLYSIPGVLLIAASVVMLEVYMTVHAEDFQSLEARADLRLLFLCIILGLTNWTGLCRLMRGEALKLREMDYVEAARAFGVGHARIMQRHILPNLMHLVMISIVLDFSGLVLAEAVLSYVNIGVDPTMNSWGNMINSARLEMAREPVVWWSLAAAFMFMLLLVLSANLFADAVRDAFDPRMGRA